MNKYDKLIDMLNKIADLNYIVTTLRWEMDTVAPKKSHDYLIEVSSKFELEAFKISTSDEYIDIINNLINSIEFKKMNDLQKKYIMDLKDEYEKLIKPNMDAYLNACGEHKPHECIMIGDDTELDILRAKQAGLNTIFVNAKRMNVSSRLGVVVSHAEDITDKTISMADEYEYVR